MSKGGRDTWWRAAENAKLYGRPKAKRREPDAADKWLKKAARKNAALGDKQDG